MTDDELIALFKLIEDSSSEDKSAKKAPAKKPAVKKPASSGAKTPDKVAASPAGRKRFNQPGRKKKGR